MAIDFFGITADPHISDKVDRAFRFERSGPRFYSEAEADLTAFVNAMNSDSDVEVIIETGDPTESNDDGKGRRRRQSLRLFSIISRVQDTMF